MLRSSIPSCSSALVDDDIEYTPTDDRAEILCNAVALGNASVVLQLLDAHTPPNIAHIYNGDSYRLLRSALPHPRIVRALLMAYPSNPGADFGFALSELKRACQEALDSGHTKSFELLAAATNKSSTALFFSTTPVSTYGTLGRQPTQTGKIEFNCDPITNTLIAHVNFSGRSSPTRITLRESNFYSLLNRVLPASKVVYALLKSYPNEFASKDINEHICKLLNARDKALGNNYLLTSDILKTEIDFLCSPKRATPTSGFNEYIAPKRSRS